MQENDGRDSKSQESEWVQESGHWHEIMSDAQEQAPSGRRCRHEGVGFRVRLGYGGVVVYDKVEQRTERA